MITRMATADDLPGIDRVFRESFCDTFAHLYAAKDLDDFLSAFTLDAWQEEFEDARYAFKVAEADGAVVGFVKLGPTSLPVQSDARYVELRQLYLLKEYHGQGIAVELIEWALAEARRRGFEEMYLTVYTENHRAKRLYERYGFEAVGRYEFMVGSHADEDIIMRKRL